MRRLMLSFFLFVSLFSYSPAASAKGRTLATIPSIGWSPTLLAS